MSTPSEEQAFAAGTTSPSASSFSSSDGSIQSKPKVIMGDQLEYPSSTATPCSSPSRGNGVVLQLASATTKKKKRRFEEEEEYGGVGCERLKRHRVNMVGRVCIPEAWGQESLLKDWVDLHAFERFIPDGLASARKALVDDCRRPPNSSCKTSC